MPLYAGLDFSGNAAQWRSGCRKSNVWLAVTEAAGNGSPVLCSLCRVQNLPGNGPPFECVLRFLQTEPLAAAAIDAPFSVPARFVPGGSHRALLELVSRLPADRRPFPKGEDLVLALRGTGGLRGAPKPLRVTERFWRSQGVNVRSTMWNGARAGAPMTAASLTLLSRAAMAVWPWARGDQRMLAEAFPAAQLRAWGLPHQGYNDPKPGAANERRSILDGIKSRTGLILSAAFEAAALSSADALDAVICTFAAKAVAESAVREQPDPVASIEGWIAVHR